MIKTPALIAFLLGPAYPFGQGPLLADTVFILFSGLRIILALLLAVYYFIFA